MDSLYAISIRGTTVYASGQLSDDECVEVEAFAQQFQVNKDILDRESIVQLFIAATNKKFQLSLTKIPIKFVFRIK